MRGIKWTTTRLIRTDSHVTRDREIVGERDHPTRYSVNPVKN